MKKGTKKGTSENFGTQSMVQATRNTSHEILQAYIAGLHVHRRRLVHGFDNQRLKSQLAFAIRLRQTLKTFFATGMTVQQMRFALVGNFHYRTMKLGLNLGDQIVNDQLQIVVHARCIRIQCAFEFVIGSLPTILGIEKGSQTFDAFKVFLFGEKKVCPQLIVLILFFVALNVLCVVIVFAGVVVGVNVVLLFFLFVATFLGTESGRRLRMCNQKRRYDAKSKARKTESPTKNIKQKQTRI